MSDSNNGSDLKLINNIHKLKELTILIDNHRKCKNSYESKTEELSHVNEEHEKWFDKYKSAGKDEKEKILSELVYDLEYSCHALEQAYQQDYSSIKKRINLK